MSVSERASRAPADVCHYWRRSTGPFLNLSDLEDKDLPQVMADLMADRKAGGHRRAFGRRYMDLRRRTEAKMRDLFIDAGGQPERLSPHYFVLGQSRWFAGLADDMEAVVMRLADLPEEMTSITYPDSFTAMGLAPEFGLPYEPKPYHEKVFRLSQLEELIDRYGLPDDLPADYDGYEQRPFEMYVEVQLWSDRPVAHLLGGRRPPSDGPVDGS